MPGFEIDGERPPVGANDTIEFVDEIKRNDMVTFVLARPGEYHVRVVKPADYSTFCGTMYQIDLSPEKDGGFQLRQVRIQFWPWDEKEG